MRHGKTGCAGAAPPSCVIQGKGLTMRDRCLGSGRSNDLEERENELMMRAAWCKLQERRKWGTGNSARELGEVQAWVLSTDRLQLDIGKYRILWVSCLNASACTWAASTSSSSRGAAWELGALAKK